MTNRGMQINEDTLVYRTLYDEMRRAGYKPCSVARELGVAYNTILRKMRQQRWWYLWECIEIRKIIKSDLPLEELFAEG